MELITDRSVRNKDTAKRIEESENKSSLTHTLSLLYLFLLAAFLAFSFFLLMTVLVESEAWKCKP